jgi:hypothetical protein
MSLCVAASGIVKVLAVGAFTLAWTHSVEKTAWREDWRVTDAGLLLVAARVKTSGAGMEPPPNARLADGWWQWNPTSAPLPELVLRDSGAAGDWNICVADGCHPVGEILGAGYDQVTLRPCADGTRASPEKVDRLFR